ncbi:uncharacterized protein LOC131953858 [Physella acuta]|uniref:uncharacterized protein LOC131953858 n=1 Tax=Physella acuta TaxID=109671 RepID=UPI0027DBCEED|nr:uncharacterized protein LOC131953858 [Physella acuta]XP_059173260.1 uncharacterized protein LOC131953858 [Physella acuta]XP_059173267.1 uncharacterized protein LOC131953858 [Physella acuta]
MEETRQTFSDVHKAIGDFTKALPTHLKSGQPRLVETLTQILSYLPLDDPAWDDEEVGELKTGWDDLQVWMELILDKTGALIKDSSKDWYSKTKEDLQWKLFLLHAAIEKMKPFNEISVVKMQVLASGIGGGNHYIGGEQRKAITRERINCAVNLL